MDSLMHSTLSEIAAYVRTIELPPPIPDTGTESFHEDDESINTTEEEEDPPGYYNGRKIQDHYPTPPSTPPPAVLLAQFMSGNVRSTPEIQSSKTVPWAAAHNFTGYSPKESRSINHNFLIHRQPGLILISTL
ncbi:hypothetical protein A1F94_012097 [Pyrenophora tritici-repentis]|nr:hypothetical protein A1F99_123830 [Pyrenophora tritici-repentis]KAF7444930.1 hypothetical protein A1F99_114830 [Pyrenophora tritici-repentis]KAF7447415.1 hypothetical protein A1F99_088620 [Pyrenophora tritici-repentis]KAF7452790.1 hypothetical protein A1F99_000480 [Pyrenophora tritici-repentis]KAG9375683.1 hypothetical protein A1F94_013739 [Pyrenophora tritici-repentis]